MSTSANSSLRPAWKGGGKGFQPPPTVASEQRAKKADDPRSNMNAFAALDDDEEAVAAAVSNHAAVNNNNNNNNSRSEALRGSGPTASGKPSGRSLSELAARAPGVPESQARAGGGSGGVGGRFERLRSDSNVSEGGLKPEAKVIRYTRERLLSMRPSPLSEPPQCLSELIGNSILSEEAQDPVCWDTFDADEIWATQPRRAAKPVAAAPGLTQQPLEEGGLAARRTTSTGTRREGGAGRWERGVALPSPEQLKKERQASNADELWDDPVGADGAAMDFSAFSDEPFDFDKMAEASRVLEKELHGERARADSDVSRSESGAENIHLVKIDPARPLASAGTTIRSGSGDDVNVFEDFDDPVDTDGEDGGLPVKSVSGDPSASSRLMDMIGVKREELPGLNLGSLGVVESKAASPWGVTSQPKADLPSISLNPWGTSLLPSVQAEVKGIDMQVLSELEEQKRRAEELRRRQEEEAQRRLAQQQAEERTRQAQMQQQHQQQAGVQSQVEIVLLERITTILENSWGRSDLPSVLATLHAEDSRVIPLLSTVDALRALMQRNSRRISVRHDPAFGSEMAILNMTNAQWQLQQQQDALAQRQQEEERRRRDELELQQQRQAAAANAMPPISVDAPWYYSDPQGNIQGPFKAHEMRQWLEAGYFKGDLPISQQQTGPFRPLQMLFPDLERAFMAPGKSAEEIAREQAEDNARLEAEHRARIEAQEAAEREHRDRIAKEEAARLERERQLQEEARRKDEAAAAAAASAERATSVNGGNDASSQQLKMMLGMPTADDTKEAVEPDVSQPAAEKKAKLPKATTSEARKVVPAPKPVKEAPRTAAPAAPSAPAWGTTPSPKTNAKTLAEIQKEEARKNAILAMQQQKSGSSGWANVAAARGGSTAWQSGTVKPTTAAVLTNPSIVPAPVVPGAPIRERQPSPGTANAHQSTIQQQNSSSSAAEEFGAKMSPALEKWCQDQMMKLNGTDDLTLVSFCMTLSNASEIRQYLTAYLGSTPQINNFATEFINKRGLGAPVQEEWESTAQVKKTRKKKGAR